MASVLLHLGILFTIAVPIISAQGLENDEPPVPYAEIELGVRLVPGSSRIVVHRKSPVLLNCSFEITDTSLLPLDYSWLKDGKVIDLTRPRSRAQLFGNGSLLLRPKRKTKKSKGRNGKKLDGLYSCNVSTAKGSFIARRVEVVIASIDRNFTKEPVSQEVQEGGVARFECKINAKPHAYYSWNRNNSQLPQDDRFSFLPSGVMQITNVKASDAGKYWCQAALYLYSIQEKITDLRWKSSGAAELVIKKDLPPRPLSIVAAPQNQSVAIGQTAFLECLGDGQPRPQVRWKKEGKTIPESQNSNLVIHNFKLEDAGLYKCSISSEGKSLSAVATLSLLAPPKMEKMSLSNKYPVPRTVNVVCKVKGTPRPSIFWYHNGKPIEKSGLGHKISKVDSGQKLTLYSTTISNSGFYQCIANNSVGTAMALSRLEIILAENAPPKPEQVYSQATSSTEVVVRFTHVQKGLPYVIFYRVVGSEGIKQFKHSHVCSIMDSQIDQHSCVVSNLKPYTKYSISVQGFSKTAASMESDTVEVTTQEDIPGRGPLLEITSPHVLTMNVSWTPLPRELSQGKIITYRILYRVADDVNDVKSRDLPGNQTSFLILDVKPETTYEVLVIPATKKGFMKLKANFPWVTYTTPSVSGKAFPHFNFIFVNLTSVKLQWEPSNSVPLSEVTGYIVTLKALEGGKNPVEENLPAAALSHIFTGLDGETKYETTLTVQTQHGSASPDAREFRMLDLSYQLVPTNVKAAVVTFNEITITWSPILVKDIQFKVCYGREDEKKECQNSDTNRFTLKDAFPFTRYKFIVHTMLQERLFSSSVLITKTKAGYPSPPVNLTVSVVQKGSVSLNWHPPLQPNGDIDSYIIMYGRFVNLDVDWKKITVTGGAKSYRIDELESEEYMFKLRAHTSAGVGDFTETKSIVPVCLKDKSCRPSPVPIPPMEEPNRVEKTRAGLSTIEYVAIIAGIIIVFIVPITGFYCRRRCMKNRDHDPNASHQPIYPSSNGHIPSIYTHTGNHRPSNGHAYPVLQTPVENANHEFMPMLQIDEHELPDSKGESDTVSIPNGLRLNGYVKHCYRPQLKVLSRLPGDNAEEMHGLMSADSNDVINGTGHSTFISSLDDIGRGETQTGDHSSEDSGTGSRRAGMLGSSQGIGSPASSPGSSTETNSSLGRRHLPSEVLRWGDEIGGMRIDPATGTVIGVVQPVMGAQSFEEDVLKEEEEEEWVQGCNSRKGSNDDESAANDRDSGHGSEAKAYHGVCTNSECDDYPACASSTNTDADYVPVSSAPGDSQLSLPLPPPPPPPPPLPLSSSSSQQLTSNPNSSSKNSKFSNKIPLSDRPSHRSARTNRFLTSHSDLPPPPPSPPRVVMSATTSSHSPLSQQDPLLAVNAGSNLPGVVTCSTRRPQRQSERDPDVAFSSTQKTPSNLPHIA